MRLLSSLLLAGLLLGSAPRESAPDLWYRHYEFALRAIERSDWEEAIHQLEMAIERRAEPSGNARTYRMRFISYYPYYYMGIVHYSLGDEERALEYFRTEEEFGEIQDSDEYGPQLATLIAASAGAPGSEEAVESAEEDQRERIREMVEEGIAHYEANRFSEAVSTFVSVLAIEPDHAESQRYLEMARRGSLNEKLAVLAETSSELVSSDLAALLGAGEELGPAAPVEMTAAPVPTPPAEEEPSGEDVAAAEEDAGAEEAPAEEAPVVEEKLPVEEAEDAEADPAPAGAEEETAAEAEAEEAEEDPAPDEEEGPGEAVAAAMPPVAEIPPVGGVAGEDEGEAADAEEAPAGEAAQAEAEAPPEEAAAEEPGPAAAAPEEVEAEEVVAEGVEAEEVAGEVAAAAPTGEPTPAESEAASASSMAQMAENLAASIFSEGRRLVEAGDLEAASDRFVSVLTILEQAGSTGELRTEARAYLEGIQAELRRSAEAQKEQQIAELTSQISDEVRSQLPPEIALWSPPVELNEPMSAEIVKVEGLVFDAGGVAEVDIAVNGQVWGEPVLGEGSASRNIRVSARTSPDETLGTRVRFQQEVVLEQGDNEIVIRARNVQGVQSERTLSVEREDRERDYWAVVMGVSEYANDSIPDLSYASRDAEAFYDYLVRDFDVPEDNVFKLIDGQVTEREMRAVLGEDLARRAEPEDVVFIFYAGHGAPDASQDDPDGDGAEKFLVPADANPARLYSTGFSMNRVAEIFQRIPAETIVFIADACFSGAAGEGRTFGAGYAGSLNDNYLNRLGGAGRIIITASMGNQLSYERDDLGHGVFTYHLIEGLKGGGDQNRDGIVTAFEVYDYVQENVLEDTGNRQKPMFKGDLGGRIPLGRTRN